jgi:hypothetical protein
MQEKVGAGAANAASRAGDKNNPGI